ncbi:acetyl-CoA synthetase-like protein [Hypoxylon sp. NC0597]|nr:acetyl-CoA synthetase-like protein [Hypoxylon sp. NC0597]
MDFTLAIESGANVDLPGQGMIAQAGTVEVRSVCDLVDRWAHERPSHTAIWYGSRSISYQELNNAATRISRILLNKQVRPGNLVPVLATRTYEMVASFLGVLKAGACYVPIDIEAWVEDRIISTLERVSARVVVNLGSSEYPEYSVVSLNEIRAALESVNEERETQPELPQAQIKPDDPAYIVFTSGTTSKPKGVMISHNALLNYVTHGDEEIPLNTNAQPEDKLLLTFSPGFDACTGIIFATICNGAQLIIAAISDFENCMANATIVIITPSMLSAIHDVTAFSQLKRLILGGEMPSVRLIEKWSSPGRKIYNGYGPTETTVGCLISEVDLSKPITLGRPTPNNRVVLLDDADIESDYGEICMMGPCLAVGYYKDETLTAQKFTYWQGQRIYRTGDFARRTEHGLVFAGRADSFVKNRGFLVNIDSQVIPMLLHTDVRTATAFMHRGRLVAFVTPENIDVRALRQSLLQSHDAFLVPDQIEAVHVLPLTANGKANNQALQQLLEAEGNTITDTDDNSGESRPSKMEILKKAISAATTVPLPEVVDDQGFSDLGGNSLAALKVLSYLRSKQLSLGIRALLNSPNLRAVCDAIQEDAPAMEGMTKTQGEEQELATGPMSALQTKMVQASFKSPGVNSALLRIHMPHADNALDKFSLRKAWYRVLHRHTVFRTVFLLKDELQQVNTELDLDWNEEETTLDRLDDVLRGRSQSILDRIRSVNEQVEVFIPVNVFYLVTVPGVSSTLLFSAHHIQADGWSLNIILNEVQAVLLGGGECLAKRPTQFIEVAQAQRKHQTDANGVSLWTKILETHLALPRLSILKPPPFQSSSEWTNSVRLDLGFNGVELEQAARIRRVTPSTLLYSAWGLVLSNYTCSDRVAFGAVFSGRNIGSVQDVEHAVGPLLNTVPFPIEFEGEQTVSDALSAVNSRLLQMLEFQWSAVEAMASVAGESINRMLQTLVVTEYDLPPVGNLMKWTVENYDLMEFGLSLLLERKNGGEHGSAGDQELQARILFDNSLYAQSDISKILKHFRNSLSGLMDPKIARMQEVRSQLMDKEEKLSLLEAPSGFDENNCKESNSNPTTIKDMFEATVSKSPLLCAIESAHGDKMSYRGLNDEANKVARELRKHLQVLSLKDVVVGVLADGSLHWVISILAVFKAGCICCPIDVVSLPMQRINTIIRQSGASIFLAANRSCAKKIQDTGNNHIDSGIIIVDEFLQHAVDFPAGQLETITELADTIYLVFTSGTTGIPKGVPLHNLTVLNATRVPPIRLFSAPGRRLSQLCALGFDMALVEIVSSLCYGATLVLKDPEDPFEHLKRVNGTFTTPSLLSALLPEDYQNLDVIALTGEPVPQVTVNTWASKVQTLINIYGPSECGCVSGTRLLPGQEVTIGRALPGLRIYVLDHCMCLVPQHVTGEIYISGSQITRGYWRSADEEKTKSRFIPNPFSSETNHRILYRTGDLGYWNGDMKISYIGRSDNQVKVRGFRVELEEVETALGAADRDNIQSAAAIALEGAEPGDQGLRIVGFVTPKDVDLTALRVKLASLLPSYARPSQILAVPALPKTSNLKLDREKLKDLALAAQSQSRAEQGTDNGDHVEKDELSPTEKLIAEAWRGLLGLSSSARIRTDDDFLALGGNSILAIKAVRIITESIGHHIPASLLIQETVLGRLANKVDQQVRSSSPIRSTKSHSFSFFLSSIKRGDNPDTSHLIHDSAAGLPLSYLEEEIFQANAISETRSAFNSTTQFVIRGPVDIKTLTEAFIDLIRGNPMLRARYIISEGRPVRHISPDIIAPHCYYDDELDLQSLRALADKPINLASEQLLKVIFWIRNGSNNEIEVVLIMHHIITDKVSIQLMLQWVSRRYGNLMDHGKMSKDNHNDIRSSELNTHGSAATYIDWVQWLQWSRYQRSAVSKVQDQEHNEFWKKHLQGIHTIPQFQRQFRGQLMGAPGSIRSILITQPNASPNSTSSKQSHMYSQRIAVAATALALRAVFGASDIVLGLPYMNRDEPGTASILGLFVDRLPIRLRLDDVSLRSAKVLLDAVSFEMNLCISNQLPYAQIQSAASSVNVNNMCVSGVDVMVVYGWQSDALERSISFGPDVQIGETSNRITPTGSIFPLQFEFLERKDGSLLVELGYSTRLISHAEADVLSTFLPHAVQELVKQTEPASILSRATPVPPLRG